MAEPLLRCTRLAKSFGPVERRVEVIRGLDLAVERGEMVAILGESGVGKTTLLHLIGGLDRPDGGSILFRGRDVARLAAADRAAYRNRELGFVFQLHHLLPEFSTLENAMMPLLIRGVERAAARDRAVTVLRELGLATHLDRRPNELSGGEQQRVAIARSIVGGPALLLADEPTGNLDERNAEVVFGLLLELHQRRGMTTLLVTHSARLAARCSRTLTLEHGSLTPSPTSRYNAESGTMRVPHTIAPSTS